MKVSGSTRNCRVNSGVCSTGGEPLSSFSEPLLASSFRAVFLDTPNCGAMAGDKLGTEAGVAAVEGVIPVGSSEGAAFTRRLKAIGRATNGGEQQCCPTRPTQARALRQRGVQQAVDSGAEGAA